MQRTTLEEMAKGMLNSITREIQKKHKLSDKQIKVADIVMVKGAYRRRDNWKICTVDKRKDGI